ncbi:MAG: hypothetical protein P4L85_03810 [Paludisphaera borealis]|uniref:LolA family protein n=1 Tax=Paludisphaera borealis TaxID=1387353 RepID=UPI00284B3619|nr:hypothetical protein [Paludisphaera borealis]MDR3618452.1 hypothetical protein [Paludisphaera borealis]
MTTQDDMDGRLARLRAEWPVGSMVDDVMARIGPESPRRASLRRRLFAGLAASGLAASLGLAWLILASHPTTLLAGVQDSLNKAKSAHLIITAWNDRDVAYRSDTWYRKGEGLRVESPDQVIVEDGKTQWAWRPDATPGELVVLRQRSPGFFTTQLPAMLALPDVGGEWTQARTPELDRDVDGLACQGFTLNLKPPTPSGAVRPVDQPAIRGLVLAEPDGRIHEITVQRRRDDGSWRREREIRIEYDVPIPAEKLAANLPAGARVIDRDAAFDSRYPLDRAIHRVELGGLILAVHDLQPLKDRGGFYVVSSVRGTPEFLKAYPPRRRPLNPEVVLLDVAFQRVANGNLGGKYDFVGLGSATRDGVEFGWWIVMPRRFFQVKDGKREYLPENDASAMPGEPGRLDDLPGKARVPLSATYWDEKHRDAKGAMQGVSTWVEVPLPPDRPPTTLEVVAGRARRDLLLMGAAGGLLGVAADAKGGPQTLRPLSHFAPEAISDADFAAAVRRGLDDLRAFDEVRDIPPEEMLPPLGEAAPKR